MTALKKEYNKGYSRRYKHSVYIPKEKKHEYSTREIADALGISPEQVLAAEKSAMKKLCVWLQGVDRQ